MATRSHIPQPPHSAGLSYKGLRAAIDPHQIPSVVDTIDADRQTWEGGQMYLTLPGKHPPMCTSDFVAVDQGNSSPKFIRMSTWNVPNSSSLATEINVPVVAVVQPFAELDSLEDQIPVVETGSAGPERCGACRAYINAWCTWTSGGNKWKCNLCSNETVVHPDYFCNLDSNFMRLDHLQRPELNKGTVDFLVSDEYWAIEPPPNLNPSYASVGPSPKKTQHRKPQPMNYVFAFDVSAEAVRSGFLRSSCDALRTTIYQETEDGLVCKLPAGSKIAVISYDCVINVYKLNGSGPADVLVVPDIEDVYLPLGPEVFVDPIEARTIIQDTLTVIPNRVHDTTARESVLGSALCAALAALAGRGGQVIMFQGVIPTLGMGQLEPVQMESNFHKTENERLLYSPRNVFWKNVADECADEGIGISMFLAPSNFLDVASISYPVSVTGGELFYHPRFNPERDSHALFGQLNRLIQRRTVYNCMMRVRCSTGLKVAEQYGNFYKRSQTDLEFGVLDPDKSITVLFGHTSTLDERQYACIQSAVLYTTTTGQRMVRTCNMALPVVTLAMNVFRYADEDAAIAYWFRKAISKISTRPLDHIRDDLTETCTATLLGYRRDCAQASVASQMVIPEAFRGLAIYTLAMNKSKILKDTFVSADVRNYQVHKLLASSTRSLVQYLYPPVMSLHDLNETIALPDPVTGSIKIPSLMRNTHIFMSSNGVYFLGESLSCAPARDRWLNSFFLSDNGEVMMIWVGNSVSPQVLLDLFGVDDINNVDPRMSVLPELDTTLSIQVRNIITHRRIQMGRTPKLFVVRQNMDGAEIEFSDMLVEDQNNGALSYLDYLCVVHKNISTAVRPA
ncbi:sec24-like protein [Thelephora ganbajun]|uniref:Sec24-like protein n=1 Tax=Thelephora ganbajun TaxID=370292 RepID=A0ACB6ZV07_THEGA|nr:sec24-like protein [Thelephora ganbajun]